jgi:hypothetical protein
MDINEFRRILTAFADEPTDVDIRLGKVVAQIRDDLIDVTIAYSSDIDRHLLITENEQQYPAQSWLINRVARLPQLADRIIASTTITPGIALQSPFVVPAGVLSLDIAAIEMCDEDQPVTDVVESLLDRVTNPLPGATSVLYITSDAGEGKTTVINRAARLQAERYKAKKTSSLVVPIPLTGKAFLTFDDAVIAALVNRLRFNYLYFDAFVELVRLGVVVPAFDGYEEMLVEGSKGEAVSALGNLVQTMNSSGTIFIAARKAFFEYISFKTQAKLFDAIGDRSASFSRLAISRWTKEKFCQYGRLRNVDDPEDIYETVAARLGVEHPLLTRAVLVRRLFDVASNISSREQLAGMLGNNPHDYFFIFVDAIVKREASEKWVARISEDIMEPLLEINEHHLLLSLIAQEMWQSSTNSIRYDVLDVIVDIFSEGLKKKAVVVRQIRERIKQHSLLASDSSRGQSLCFDHEDFQNFYLGEGLGLLLVQLSRTELQAFLSVNLVPTATIEQAVQYLIRNKTDFKPVLTVLLAINESESGFSFCKENCGALAIRVAECIHDHVQPLVLINMFFTPGVLSGRTMQLVLFENCHFQPTGTFNSALMELEFRSCEFERLEVEANQKLSGCTFSNCRIESLILAPEGEPTFDPMFIEECLSKLGANITNGQKTTVASNKSNNDDDQLRQLERLLRIFLRTTSVGDGVIRLRLGKIAHSFIDDVLPVLLESHVLEEVPWMGKGMHHRYKLALPMSEISTAIEQAQGSFDGFLAAIKGKV